MPAQYAVSYSQNQSLFMYNSAGRVGVNITASDVQGLEPALVQLGLQVDGALPQDHLIEGYLPTTSLIAAAGLSAARGCSASCRCTGR